MLEFIIAIRDVLFALLMSWAGMGDEESSQKHGPGEEASHQRVLSAPVGLSR